MTTLTPDEQALTEQIAAAMCPGVTEPPGCLDCLAQARAVLPVVKTAQREAWDNACQAFAWCRDNGPIEDALPYVAENNPYPKEAP